MGDDGTWGAARPVGTVDRDSLLRWGILALRAAEVVRWTGTSQAVPLTVRERIEIIATLLAFADAVTTIIAAWETAHVH